MNDEKWRSEVERDSQRLAQAERGRHSLLAQTVFLGSLSVLFLAPLLGGDDRVCELRKFYLSPAIRGLGLEQALLDRCLLGARGFGFTQCYAEVLDRMSEMQRLLEGLLR